MQLFHVGNQKQDFYLPYTYAIVSLVNINHFVPILQLRTSGNSPIRVLYIAVLDSILFRTILTEHTNQRVQYDFSLKVPTLII